MKPGYTKHKPVVFEVGNQTFTGRICQPIRGYYYLEFDGPSKSNCEVFTACGLDRWDVAREVFGQNYRALPNDASSWPPCPTLAGLKEMIKIVKKACKDSDKAAREVKKPSDFSDRVKDLEEEGAKLRKQITRLLRQCGVFTQVKAVEQLDETDEVVNESIAKATRKAAQETPPFGKKFCNYLLTALLERNRVYDTLREHLQKGVKE